MSAADHEQPRGAYGLRIRGVDEARDLLVEADPAWPGIELAWRLGESTADHDWVKETSARLQLRTGGHIEIDREAERVVFVVPRALRHEELVHPYLSPVAAVMAHWTGRESVHAGAFVADGGVWGVVGARESGKSSILAWLALHGAEIVCDDMLIVEGGRALAGPRSLDLRADSAQQLGAGAPIGFAGARERWRLRLGPVSRDLEVRGWIFLGWGERVEAIPVTAGDRVGNLVEHRGARLPSKDPTSLLDLVELPAWELRRPRDWDSLPEAADRLLELVGR